MAVNRISTIKQYYSEFLERFELLIQNSSLVYVENSSEVIDGGMYSWGHSDVLNETYRMALVEEYLIIVTRMRLDLEDKASKELATFDHSCNIVLTYLKQETLLIESTKNEVMDAIKRQLAIQYFLLLLPVENNR